VVAQALHAVSGRSAKPLITVNTGGLPEGIFESELFGHVKGAFTDARADRVGRFELADGGTLFLDEIANITPAQQAKLLRVLGDRRVRAGGLVEDAPRGCADLLGHHSKPGDRGWRRADSAKICCSG